MHFTQVLATASLLDIMIALFWACFVLVLYTYFVYPVLVYVVSRLRPRLTKTARITPRVTVLIPAYNEERCIRDKIMNTLAFEYPREAMEIVVISDGSSDRTVEIAAEFALQGVRVLNFPERSGKKELLNRVVSTLHTEVIMATDSAARLHPEALGNMVQHFADPTVGCVTGARTCVEQPENKASLGEGLYWRYEAWVKACESRIHSCMGLQGQLYAVRASVFPTVEAGAEDFYIAMKMIEQTGLRAICEPSASCSIAAAARLDSEMKRKVRAHASFLRTLPRLWRLLLPWRNPVWWQYLSHHVCRRAVPVAMIAMAFTAVALARQGGVYLIPAAAQLVFYTFAALGYVLTFFGRRPKMFYLPFYFIFANLTILLAASQMWSDPQEKWDRTERLPVLG